MMKINHCVPYKISKRVVFSIGVFLLLSVTMIGACTPRETVIVANTPTLSTNFHATSTPRSVATATQPVTPTEIQSEQTMSKILLSLGSTEPNGCLANNRAEIWISEYPFDVVSALAQDPNTDFLYPSWSPNNGEWVAYVASSPLEATDPTNVPQKTGTDSVWIMRGDGSNKRKISEDIPSVLIRSSMDDSCLVQSRISLPLVWSPDGRYIIFAQATWDKTISKLVYNYYSVDIASGNMEFLLSQTLGVLPAWTVENVVAISGEGIVTLIKGFGANALTKIKIPYPTNIPSESQSFVSTMGNDGYLVISFRLGSTLISPVPKAVSVWELNPISEEWKLLTTIDKQTWGIPHIGAKWVALCDENAITIINFNSWRVAYQITSHEFNADWINCGLLKLNQQQSGNDLLTLAINSENGLKIETVILQAQKQDAKNLLDSSVFSPLPENRSILDFSLSLDT